METNRCLLHLGNMSQEELYALIQSDEEILVALSDLESECSDRYEGSEDQDMFTLHDVDELVLEDSPEYKDLSSDWDSEDDLPLSTIRKNTILQKEPTWSNLNKPTPSGTFDKTNSGVPNFIKQMQGLLVLQPVRLLSSPVPRAGPELHFSQLMLNVQINRGFSRAVNVNMADLDNLEYYIKFPSPNFNYNQNGDHDFVFVVNEEKIPVILLFGWAGCQDKYLAKYSQIYEERGLITLRYTAPVKCLFWRRYQMITIGEKLVKLLVDLNFDNHPIIVHCFSNGGAFLYQNFSLALRKYAKPLPIKGVIFDSAPGRRRILSLFRAISAILGGNVFYNFSMSLIMTMFLSMIWIYEVISNAIYPKGPLPQTTLLGKILRREKKGPQLFIYSKKKLHPPYGGIWVFLD
ncbi:hypothetical protein JTB14_013129 [Gonioctena quinquepunctata]|nr:hypothetical protein JTB14_013129 [Gonioctena quinquepunctata]